MQSLLRNNSLSIILPVWGDEYIYLAEEFLFFSLLKKNNLPLFLQKANFNSVNMLICTKKLDVEKFKGNNFINLKKKIDIKFLPSDELIVERKYTSYSNLIKLGLKHSSDKRYLIFVSPDEYYLDGSFNNLFNFLGKKKIFFSSFLRCNNSEVLKGVLLSEKTSNLEKINESIKNLHINEKKLNIDYIDFDNRSPSKLFCNINNKLISRNFHSSPILIDKNDKDLSEFEGTIDDIDFLERISDGDSNSIYLEQNFQNFGIITFENQNQEKKTFQKKFSFLDFFNFTTRRVGKIHWQLFKKIIYYNCIPGQKLENKKFNFVSKLILKLENISMSIYNFRKKKF
tara:strand:+ start:1636 stop:2661 length:1026 start_codon:yes stop_codon:yes gene_type:complete